MPNITPFLWYSDSLDEVITYYRAIFPDFREISASPQSASFEIAGQWLNWIGLPGRVPK